MARPHRLRVVAGDESELREIAEHADQAVMQADIDEPPAPGLCPLVQCGEDRHRPKYPADHVAQRNAELHRHMAALAIDAERARQGLRHDVERRLVPQRALEAKAADRAVDEARVDSRQRLVAKPEPVHDARAVILDEDVRVGNETAQDVGARLLLQVDDEALLVAVDAEEIVALARDKGRKLPRLVPEPRRLDLQHLGAEITEALGAKRPGQDAGQIDDPEPRERPRPCALFVQLTLPLSLRAQRSTLAPTEAPADQDGPIEMASSPSQ